MKEPPTDLDKCLVILILRKTGCSQDEVASLLHCWKRTVGEVEQWFADPDKLSYQQAIQLCSETAIRSAINIYLVPVEEVDKKLLEKATCVTGDNLIRHYRTDYFEPDKSVNTTLESNRFLPLLYRWREQSQFLSLDKLIESYWLDNLQAERDCEVSESEEVTQRYFDIYMRNRKVDSQCYKPILHVENESLFGHLKASYPDIEVWRAQESWSKAYSDYINTFLSWATEVEHVTESAVASALKEDTSGASGSEAENTWRLLQDAKRLNPEAWLSIRFIAITLACDLLPLGIQKQPEHVMWYEAQKIRRIRAAVVRKSMEELPQRFWLTANSKVHVLAEESWENNRDISQKTMALLKALKILQTTQSNLHEKLNLFELSLLGSG